MRKWLILPFLCSTASVEAQPVWTWVDSAGVTHYSDRPVPGAREIELGAPQTYSAPSAARTERRETAPAPAPAASTAPYRSLAIASPAPEENLWNIGGTLNVSVTTEPQLTRNHRVDLYFDGRRLGLEASGTSFTISDVARGTHTLQAVVVDATTRAEVQRSEARTFHVHQTSVQSPQSPPQGPALRTAN
jgi:hypothetical protein